MKKLLLCFALATPVGAQISNPSIIFVGSAPVGVCVGLPDQQTATALYICSGGTWTALGTGGGSVTSFTDSSGLFNVATPTTTPTTTYNTQTANTAFGNFTGSTAAPSFTATTGTGSPVAATSPILVTPLLGTPTSGVITNLTGTCSACGSNTAVTATSATTAANLSGGSTVTGTPAASVSAVQTNAALFTGGSATTTFPYVLLQPSTATAETAWSTNGTFIGVNSASGFAGNFIDFHLNNGASLFSVASSGAITALGVAIGGQIAVTAAGSFIKGPGFQSTGTKFTASGCTSITSTTGGGAAGKFTIGGNSCTVVITINGATGLAATNGWSCRANDETTAAGNTGLYFSTNNTTTATLTVPAGAAASDVIDFNCMAY